METKANKSINEAVKSFLQLVSKGWDTETACICMHDGVHDGIDIDCFISLCMNAVKEEHLKTLN